MTGNGDSGPDAAELEASEAAFEKAKEAAERAGGQDLPAIDFSTFVLSLSHSALVHLGDAPDPSGGTAGKNLPLARQTIDLLALLQDKTRGNLDGQEEHILDQALYDLRMRFVEVSKGQ
jgi:hypothetical protein